MASIPKKPIKDLDAFITGGQPAATGTTQLAKRKKVPRFLLEIDEDLRTQLNIEAKQARVANVSVYIVSILRRRGELAYEG